MKLGDRGHNVAMLQKKLNMLGYKLDEDGVFGYGTRNAVIKFQISKGLMADGIAGPKTMAALDGGTPNPSKPIARVLRYNGSNCFIAEIGKEYTVDFDLGETNL